MTFESTYPSNPLPTPPEVAKLVRQQGNWNRLENGLTRTIFLRRSLTMKKLCALSFFAYVTVLLAAMSGAADVRLPSIISYQGVLQQGRPVPIWGWATPGEQISVRIDSTEVKTMADTNGEWRVSLPAHKADCRPLELIVAGQNTRTLTNVLYGEVWICGGQSNMGSNIGGVASSREVARLNDPLLSQFFIRIVPTNEPQRDCIGGWRADRRQPRDRVQAPREQAGGRALRLGEPSRHQPLQPSRTAYHTVSNRRLAGLHHNQPLASKRLQCSPFFHQRRRPLLRTRGAAFNLDIAELNTLDKCATLAATAPSNAHQTTKGQL